MINEVAALRKWFKTWKENPFTYGIVDGLCINSYHENIDNPQPLYDGIRLSKLPNVNSDTGIGYAAIIKQSSIVICKYHRHSSYTIIESYIVLDKEWDRDEYNSVMEKLTMDDKDLVEKLSTNAKE